MKKIWMIVFLAALCVSFSALAFAQDEEGAPKGVGRLGLGIPYGLFGLNYEHPINDMISLQGGLGYAIAGPGWAAGAKVYAMKNTGTNIRFFLTGLYGTTTLLDRSGVLEDLELKTGAAAGIGFGKRSWQVEIIYPFTKVPAGFEEQGSNVKFAFGWSIF